MKPLLQPMIALIAWSMIMWAWMYATRIPAMKKAGIDLGKIRGGKGTDLDGVLPAKTQWVSHNYNHLMEQPTLFYAVIAALVLMEDTSDYTRYFAWAYVGFRVLHSLVQAIDNRISIRFPLFMLASACLFLLTLRALVGAFLVA